MNALTIGNAYLPVGAARATATIDRVLAAIPEKGASYHALLRYLAPIDREQLDSCLLALERARKIKRTLGRFFPPGRFDELAHLLLPPGEVEATIAASAGERLCPCCRKLRPALDFKRKTPGRRHWSGYRNCFDCRAKLVMSPVMSG